MKKDNWIVLTVFVVLAALSRLVPHPMNVTPIAAMALFGAAYFNRKLLFVIPVLALFVSDLLVNNILYSSYYQHFVFFYQGAFFVYLSFFLIAGLGVFLLKKIAVKNIILSSLLASTLFFLISNFGVWMTGTMYPHTFGGLIACYTMAIPFFGNTLLGDLFYVGVLFGGYELVKMKALKQVNI